MEVITAISYEPVDCIYEDAPSTLPYLSIGSPDFECGLFCRDDEEAQSLAEEVAKQWENVDMTLEDFVKLWEVKLAPLQYRMIEF